MFDVVVSERTSLVVYIGLIGAVCLLVQKRAQTFQIGKALPLARARIFQRCMPDRPASGVHTPQAQQISLIDTLIAGHFVDLVKFTTDEAGLVVIAR